MTLRNYTRLHDVGSVRKENYIDELFRGGQKREKASARQKSQSKTKTNKTFNDDSRLSIRTGQYDKKKNKKQIFHKYYGK